MGGRDLVVKKIVMILVILLGTVPAVFAYLDPGLGIMLLNIIIGAVVTAFVTAKLWWKRFARWLRISFSAGGPSEKK